MQLYETTLFGIFASFFQYNESMKRKIFFFSLLGCLSFACLSLTACREQIDYSAFLSENRSNVLLAEGEDYHLRVYAVDKEYPYCTDGYVGEVTARAEVYYTVKNGGEDCQFSFYYNGVTLGGEMSYDSVEGEYTYSCAANIADASSLEITIVQGDEEKLITARSVKTSDTLSSLDVLSCLQRAACQPFSALTKKESFEGEIYLRLIYESAPYYYVGVIGRDKKTTAYLLDAVTGEILATKSN